MSHRLETFRAADVLLELLRTQRIDWQDVLIAGGVDVLEVEHREFVELVIHENVVTVLSTPL